MKHEREDSASELQEREKKYLDKMSSLRSRHEDDVKLLQMEHSSKVGTTVCTNEAILAFFHNNSVCLDT